MLRLTRMHFVGSEALLGCGEVVLRRCNINDRSQMNISLHEAVATLNIYRQLEEPGVIVHNVSGRSCSRSTRNRHLIYD